MARVEGRLAAADLVAWERNLDPCCAQERLGVRDRSREDEVPEAGRE